MNKILWHAISVGALVRSTPNETAPILKSIVKGTWLGVIQEVGEWIYVIGKESIGWVRRSELKNLETQALHINRADDQALEIRYMV